MQTKIMTLILGLVILGGCCQQQATEPPAKPVQTQAGSEPMSEIEQMRQKAKVAEAASLVGYDGKAIKRDLDKIIDQHEQMQKQLDGLKDF